jgi:hypothetical protein
MLRSALLALMLLGTGCAPTIVSSDHACGEWAWVPYEDSDLDRISPKLAEGLRKHNGHYQEVCE